MARRRNHTAFMFDAFTLEGTLIAPAMLARIAAHATEGQKEADYAIPKGLSLRDEIARYFRIGQALSRDFTAHETPSAAATVKFIEALLRDVFGFNSIERPGTRRLLDRDYVVTLDALSGRVPVIVVPPADALDKASAHLQQEGRRRSASSAIQDWLNANDAALWGFCTNGECFRLLRDNQSLTRPAYIEADLRQIFEGEAFADFAALWLLIHASRFGMPGAPAADSALERWRDAGAKEGLAARDRLRDGVEAALLALGNGFLSHPGNRELAEKIQSGQLPLPIYFGELLRLVYRLIFLLVAEERGLLHAPDVPAPVRALYAGGYCLRNLRDHAVRRAIWDHHHDRWEGLLTVFRSLHAGEKRLGLPALGGLFLPQLTPALNNAKLANRSLMEAIYRLAWLKEESSLVPVNWRDMETEELGSVYESLLELTPRLGPDGRSFIFAAGSEGKGHARKTSGSYYTPDSLVQALLDSALDPVLERVEAESENPETGLLSLTVIDPACGSGHFLLAAARRIATRLARIRAGGVASAEDYRHALRDVARSCIHGVDRNPMAVELSKVALWIETVEPGKPLGFLDANIRCGDALLGLFDLGVLRKGIPDDAYAILSGDDRAAARYYAQRNKSERKGQGELDFAGGGGKLPAPPPLAEAIRRLRSLPEDSTEEIAEKRRVFEAALADPRRWAWRVAADLYVAAFLVPKMDGAPENPHKVTVPTTHHVWQALTGATLFGPLTARAQDLAGEVRAFHWPLEFPDVMANGGFDVVLGNPPWEVMQISEEEYFAQRLPEIAELAGAARKRAIAALATENPKFFASYVSDKRRSEAGNEYARSSGRFELAARGKVNTYALFAELFVNLVSARGRAGAILPTGIATDATTAPFFASLVGGRNLATLFDFENRDAIFPAVHRSYKFSLLTIGKDVREAGFAFFLTDTAQLTEPERRFNLSAEDIARINPNTKTAPVFRSRADAALTAKIYARVPVLIDETKGKDGNPWGIDFRQGLFNMTSDSGLFRTAAQLAHEGYSRDGTDWVLPARLTPNQQVLDLPGGRDVRGLDLQGGGSAGRVDRYVPLYEAKMINYFDHRFGSYEGRGDDRGFRVLPAVPLSKYQDPNFEPQPYYWVPDKEVRDRTMSSWQNQWFISFKDVTAATNERTTIFSVIPLVGVGHTSPLMLTQTPPQKIGCLLCNLNSIVVDYCARTKVGGLHLTFTYLKQFPVLPTEAYDQKKLDFVTPRLVELTYTSHAIAPFARDLGYDGPPFAWDEDRRALLRAELDAFYAKAYGLSRDELRYILDPSDVKGSDYPSETFRVLKINEIRKYGEYRTARLVLDAWDRMERGELG